MENKSIKVFPDFENIVKAIDPRLTVVQNPNNKDFANIKIDGVDICPIPSGEILERPEPSYTVLAPNGWRIRHKSQEEAIAQVKDTLEKIKNPEFAEMFFDK